MNVEDRLDAALAGNVAAFAAPEIPGLVDTGDEVGGALAGWTLDPGKRAEIYSAALAIVDASGLLEYQEVQAVLAHQTGGLYRDLGIEGVEDAADRRRAWIGALRRLVSRPDPGEAMNEAWHWA